MKHKVFSNDLTEALHQQLKMAKQQNSKLIAAFDADGTLWDTDIGENFFDFLITESCVGLPEEPWTVYLEMKKKDPVAAYFWLAQILEGVSIDQVRSWAHEALKRYEKPLVFEPIKDWINTLKNQNVEIYVVTASVKWSVEAAVQDWLGLTPDQVIGIETQISPTGNITSTPCYPATYREGKVAALIQKTKNERPFFCAGNSEGDLELLACATHLALAIQSPTTNSALKKSEWQLQIMAEKKKWHRHSF